jgi:hypothetical protein
MIILLWKENDGCRGEREERRWPERGGEEDSELIRQRSGCLSPSHTNKSRTQTVGPPTQR